jgi:hypothetical protein
MRDGDYKNNPPVFPGETFPERQINGQVICSILSDF